MKTITFRIILVATLASVALPLNTTFAQSDADEPSASAETCVPADVQVSPWESSARQLFDALAGQCLPVGEHEVRGADSVSIFAGSPPAYASRVTFHDLRIDKTLMDGFDAGGTIEVYASPGAVMQRARYLAAVPPWAGGRPVLVWGCSAGNAILLVASDLSQDDAAEYCDTFFKVAPQNRPQDQAVLD